MRVPRFSSIDEEREWFERHAEEVDGIELPDNPFAAGRTCARCGWLTSDRLCPNCGADPDAAVV